MCRSGYSEVTCHVKAVVRGMLSANSSTKMDVFFFFFKLLGLAEIEQDVFSLMCCVVLEYSLVLNWEWITVASMKTHRLPQKKASP